MWHWKIRVMIVFEQTSKVILEYSKTQLSAQITWLSSINTTRLCICIFCSTRLVFPISKSLFARAPVLHLHPSLSPISLQVCLSVFSHLWSLFSAGGGSSGSGNRSVRCHYSSNSVIRHRALPAHAACLARTRRVQLGAWVEIRFDTRRGGLALEGFRGVQEWKWGLELAGDKEGTEIRMDRERGRF